MLSLIQPTKVMVIGFLVIGAVGLALDGVRNIYEIATSKRNAAVTGVYLAKTLMGDEDTKDLLIGAKKFRKHKDIIDAEVVKDAK